MQNWITHHRSSAARFKPDVNECEDGTNLWVDVSVTPAGIRVPTSLQRIVIDSLHGIAHPWLEGWTNAHQTVLMVAIHEQIRRNEDRIVYSLTKSEDSCPHENVT